ncbi:MAG: PIN domain-containing protein [Chloroflexota bacterium]
MSAMVDTSVWIDFFRGSETIQASILRSSILDRKTILTGDLIMAELWQGVRNNRELHRVEGAFSVLPVMQMVGETIARESADYYRRLRRQGITVRKTIDCLIAAWCIHNHVPLLHADRDFIHYAQFGLIEAA